MARVLLIDDDPNVLYPLSRLLEAHGHQVATASTFFCGMAALQGHRPEAVICDGQLPLDRNAPIAEGYGLVITKVARDMGIRTVLYTGSSELSQREFERGGVAVMKPSRVEVLLEALGQPVGAGR